MILHINENTRLELTAPQHAEALFDAVDANRKHLSEFLPWVPNMQSVDDFRNYIKRCEFLHAQQEEVSFVIKQNDTLVGRIGLHYMNKQNRFASIGYWLIADAAGKGIITQSCRELITYGFSELGLHRIEIKAAVENHKSRAIPEKLGFKQEGILREAEWVNDRFLDLYVYAMLAPEWNS